MIAKKNRFHGHKSVSRVRGNRVQLDIGTVYYARTNRTDYRLAVIVSKKTARLAVTRNRIRRRIFESFRKQQLLDGKSIDAVFVVRKETVASMPATDLDNMLAKAAAKMTATKS